MVVVVVVEGLGATVLRVAASMGGRLECDREAEGCDGRWEGSRGSVSVST